MNNKNPTGQRHGSNPAGRMETDNGPTKVRYQENAQCGLVKLLMRLLNSFGSIVCPLDEKKKK